MQADLLAILISIQVWIVVILFAFLVWNRVGREWRERREAERTRTVTEALRGWQAGNVSDEEMVDALRPASVRAAWEAFQDAWSELGEHQAYRARGLIRDSAWFGKVRRSVRSLFWWRRLDAVQMLTYLGRREDAPLLERLLSDRQPMVRMAAVFTARRLTLPELVDPLLQGAMDAPSTRRKAYLDALLAYGDELVPRVRRRLRTAEEARELITLLELAGELPEHATSVADLSQAILPHTTDERDEIRIKSVTALGSYEGDDMIVPALHSALRDDAWPVRAKAAGALGLVGSVESREQLGEALADPHWWVRLRAGIALRQLGSPGLDVLRAVDQAEDPFAHDMSRYVLKLDDRALTGYVA